MRLAELDCHSDAITSRPLLLYAVAPETHPAGGTRLTVTSSHERRPAVIAAWRRNTGFSPTLVRSAEQLCAENREDRGSRRSRLRRASVAANRAGRQAGLALPRNAFAG